MKRRVATTNKAIATKRRRSPPRAKRRAMTSRPSPTPSPIIAFRFDSGFIAMRCGLTCNGLRILQSITIHEFDFALGKSLCPEEFTGEMRPEEYRRKAARY